MWVKVCGVTTRKAAEAAVDVGADAIGLVLLDSPRRISIDQAREIAAGLDVERVMLWDGDDPDEAMSVARTVGATGVQPYGPRAAVVADRAAQEDYLVLRPVPIGESDVDLGTVLDPAMGVIPLDQMPLLDSAHETLRGGSGETFDWSSTAGLSRPFVAAGGLGPDNVGAAIERLRPWGVDASSRLESSPGRMDEQLVRDFVTTAKHGMRPA